MARQERDRDRRLQEVRISTLRLQLESLSDLDSRLANVSFAVYERAGHNALAHDLVQKWTELQQQPNLIVHGPVGCGKTFLARCAYRALTDSDRPALWMNLTELLRELKLGFRDKETAEKASARIMAARNAPVLFLDDLGKSKPGEGGWLEETLYNIVDPRYRFELPTIVTTEYVGAELEARVGASVETRIEHGAWVAGIRKPAVEYRRLAHDRR